MSRLDAVLDTLRHYKQEMGPRYGIEALGVFGSVARSEETAESDVDVVIRMRPPNLLVLSRIRQKLEERMQRPVDIVRYREQMNPFLRQRIDREARYV